jgi:hypothetical protein
MVMGALVKTQTAASQIQYVTSKVVPLHESDWRGEEAKLLLIFYFGNRWGKLSVSCPSTFLPHGNGPLVPTG